MLCKGTPRDMEQLKQVKEWATTLQASPQLPLLSPSPESSPVRWASAGLHGSLASRWSQPVGGTSRLEDGKRMKSGYLLPGPQASAQQYWIAPAKGLGSCGVALFSATVFSQGASNHSLCLLLHAPNQYICFTTLLVPLNPAHTFVNSCFIKPS